jgi:hypothetical protein
MPPNLALKKPTAPPPPAPSLLEVEPSSPLIDAILAYLDGVRSGPQ